MYKLYTDKVENLKCNIGVEGASIENTFARLILENEDFNILFEGQIQTNGDCIIPIKKLKNILKEGTKGNMKLEVVADDSYFSPWNDQFQVDTNKKITVEVANNSSKAPLKENIISVNVTKPNFQESKEINHPTQVANILLKEGINYNNIKKNMVVADEIIKEYLSLHSIKNNKDLLKEIITKLK